MKKTGTEAFAERMTEVLNLPYQERLAIAEEARDYMLSHKNGQIQSKKIMDMFAMLSAEQ